MSRRLLGLVLVCHVLAWSASADDLRRQVDQVFRQPANPDARKAVVKRIEAVGGERAARLLLGIIRRSDRPLQQHYLQREALGAKIDGVFGPAIKARRMLTGSEDAGLQQIKARQATLDGAVAAELAGFRAAGAALARLSDQAALTVLRKATGDGDWFVRLAVARALQESLGDKDPRVRIAVARTMTPQQAAAKATGLGKLLGDEYWEVRAAVIAALGRSGALSAIRLLIDRLSLEQGRLREDIDAALQSLTGYGFHGNPKLWGAWWEANKKQVAAGTFRKRKAQAGKPWQTRFSFYGIHSLSNRVVFVLDRSSSMKQQAQHKPPVLSGLAKVFHPQGDRKIDVARAQLKTALANLPPGARFNVVFYNQGVLRFSPRLIPATPGNLARVFQFIDTARAAGGTNIFDAMFAAGNIRGARDAGLKLALPNLKENPDTVFLLSDGYPNYGRLKQITPLIEELLWLNRQRRQRVHTIGIGDHNKMLMQRLAQATGGRYVGLK